MLQIDGSLFVTFFIVWILVFILSKIFWKPMVRTTQERDDRIQGDQEASRRGFSAYEQSLREIDTALKAARLAADKTRETLEAEALKEKSRLLAEIGASAKDQIEKAKAKVLGEIAQLKTELAAEAGRLAGDIEKRLLT
jgi:F-type H+-transporting ATPase subunit b